MIYGHCGLAAHAAFYQASSETLSLQLSRVTLQKLVDQYLFSLTLSLQSKGGMVLFRFCLLLLFPSTLWLVIAFLYHSEIYSLFNSIFIFYDYVSLTHKRVLGNMF